MTVAVVAAPAVVVDGVIFLFLVDRPLLLVLFAVAVVAEMEPDFSLTTVAVVDVDWSREETDICPNL